MDLKRIISGAVLIVIVLIYGLAGITEIDPGEVGLVVQMIGNNRGIQEDPLATGTHWIEPFSNDVVTYDTRAQQYYLYDPKSDAGVPAATMDGQPILVDVSLEVSLLPSNVKNLHQGIGSRYYDQVVYPKARSLIREWTARKLSDEIYTGEGRKFVQDGIESELHKMLADKGINVIVNLRDIVFTNKGFVATLERKAEAAQKVIIAEREAEAAVNNAKKVANDAEGEKQKRIKAAEAEREELRLNGEGERLKQEEIAKGILAIKKAEAEGARLQVQAYGDGKTYASVKWAENLGPNVKVYGIPTGAPGTSSIVDLNGVIKNAFGGVK